MSSNGDDGYIKHNCYMLSAMLRTQKVIVMKGVSGPFIDEETEASFKHGLLLAIENK